MKVYIPDHIIFGQILPLVPSEKLNEWKVACKSWYYNLHVNPSLFIKDQLAKARRSHIFDVWRRHEDTPLLNMEFKLDSTTKTIKCISHINNLADIYKNIGLPCDETITIGSCNGLVLVNRDNYPEFHLINPSTRQWTTLPLPYKRNRRLAHTMFGYDESSGKYKVLLFGESHDSVCKLLTLGSKTWKSVILPYKVRGFLQETIIIDGYMNVLCSIYTDEVFNDYLLAFDMGKETFELLKLPTVAIHILNVRNSLAIVPMNGSSYMYYILDDRKNGTWTKKYIISSVPSGPDKYILLTMCNNGNTFIFKDPFSSRLFYFDPETFCYQQIVTFWDDCRHYWLTSIDYVDTLVSPHAVTRQKRKLREGPESAIPLRRSLRLQKRAKVLPCADGNFK